LDRLGDDKLVLDIGNRYVDANPGPNSIGVTTARVNHVFADDIALFGHHFPFTAGQQVNTRHPVVADDGRAHISGGDGHSVTTSGRVHMAVVQRPGAGNDPGGVHKGIDSSTFLGTNDLHAEANIGGDALYQPEIVEFLRRDGKADTAATVPTGRLAGHLFQFWIEGVTVMVHLGHIVIGDEAGALTGRMPG
jgi:hypothetical protein